MRVRVPYARIGVCSDESLGTGRAAVQAKKFWAPGRALPGTSGVAGSDAAPERGPGLRISFLCAARLAAARRRTGAHARESSRPPLGAADGELLQLWHNDS